METRLYNGWNEQEINRDLRIFEEIEKEKLPVEEKAKKFKELTKKGRRTYFNYKAFLQRKYDALGFNKYQKKREENCYFCGGTEKLMVHHVDFNHKNNDEDNLLTLCESCHVKLHKVQKKCNEILKSHKEEG